MRLWGSLPRLPGWRRPNRGAPIRKRSAWASASSGYGGEIFHRKSLNPAMTQSERRGQEGCGHLRVKGEAMRRSLTWVEIFGERPQAQRLAELAHWLHGGEKAEVEGRSRESRASSLRRRAERNRLAGRTWERGGTGKRSRGSVGSGATLGVWAVHSWQLIRLPLPHPTPIFAPARGGGIGPPGQAGTRFSGGRACV